MDPKKIGELISNGRKEKGLTMDDVAVKCSTTRQNIKRIESGNLMANATLMGKPHNVRPADVFKLKYWQQYEKALVNKKGYRFEDLRTVKNGDNGGSWIHQELIIEFARRLSPEFAIWCNDCIAELIKEGEVKLEKPKSQIEVLLASVQLLAEQEKRVNIIESRVEQLEAKSITSPTDYYSVAGFWSTKKTKIDTAGANRIGREAAKLCKENGYMIGKVPDARYGAVNTYPSDILSLIFSKEKNLSVL